MECMVKDGKFVNIVIILKDINIYIYMNKYLIPFLISASIGVCYFYNNRNNSQVKTLGIKEVNMNKINKDIIKLETIEELKNEEINDEALKNEELKNEELKDYTEHVENKERYRIVVYKPEGWEIID